MPAFTRYRPCCFPKEHPARNTVVLCRCSIDYGLSQNDSRRMGEFYHKMFESRQKGDYEDLFSFEKQDIEAWLIRASEFIDVITRYLEHLGK